MDRSPRTPGAPRQRPLLFPATNGPVGPWNGLAERHQQECRQALRQMLVAVARHARTPSDAQPGPLDQGPEGHTHD